MRRTLFAPVMLALLLLGCQMTEPGGGGAGITDDSIAVTPLDGPQAGAPATVAAPDAVVAAAAKPGTPHPKTRPADLAAAEEAPAAPDAPDPAAEPDTPDPAAEPDSPKTAEQMLCEKAKGQWVSAGDSGAHYCASMTKDGGKQCSRKTQCEGQCLARSGTCSPVTPLYGCNDVLEKDGRQVTLCID